MVDDHHSSAYAVHFQSPLSEAERDFLLAALQVPLAMSEGPELPAEPRYRVLVAGRPARAELEASPDLTTLIIPWAGLPGETRTLLADFPDIQVHNLHHNAAPVAELALMLLLAAAKFAIRYDTALRSGDWRIRYRRPAPSILLEDKTALVLGYGAIGQRVARACRAMGMRVIATRRHAAEPYTPEEGIVVYPGADLPSLLPEAQALIICLPHTPETDGLLGEDELALLPPGSVLVNIGRAQIVDEAALFEALESGHLHAAGLDVWYSYPPDEPSRSFHRPSAYPFDKLDNVVMSPHRGGAVTETNRLRMTALAELLNIAAQGRPLPHRVNVELGY